MRYPQDTITQGSKELWSLGIRVLQGNQFAPTEGEHLQKLIDYMELTGNERSVADMGCGFGAVSVAISKVLPKARLYLVNTNEFQLSRCPKSSRYHLLCEDMTNTSITVGSIDLVMFNYSLCHANAFPALWEAARITPTGGRLFVYDYARIGGTDELSEVYLHARFKSEPDFRLTCSQIGWTEIETIYPGGDDLLFRQAMANDELYNAIFEDLVPVIYKAKRA